MITERLDITGYEEVYRFTDTGFSAFIAIHNTQLGPALGGCRVKSYDSDGQALRDVLLLAKGMTLKNSLAGLDYGGGKMVVNAPDPTRDRMHLVGEAVETLQGRYLTADDVGTTIDDMKIAAQRTRYVATLGGDALPGDPSPWTALGVFHCILAAVAYRDLQNDDTGLKIWVQGLGKVGWGLIERLANSRRPFFDLYVSDLLPDRVAAACTKFGATEYTPDKAAQMHVYAPCAMGQVIRVDNVDDIRFPIICGCANNQLETDELAQILNDRGFLYCPDFLVSAGGVISAASEITGYDEEAVRQSVIDRGVCLIKTFEMAEDENTTPLEMAKLSAHLRLASGPALVRTAEFGRRRRATLRPVVFP
jgi:leucine dehydrogenase